MLYFGDESLSLLYTVLPFTEVFLVQLLTAVLPAGVTCFLVAAISSLHVGRKSTSGTIWYCHGRAGTVSLAIAGSGWMLQKQRTG